MPSNFLPDTFHREIMQLELSANQDRSDDMWFTRSAMKGNAYPTHVDANADHTSLLPHVQVKHVDVDAD